MDVAFYLEHLPSATGVIAQANPGFDSIQLLMLAGGLLGLGFVLRSTYRRLNRTTHQPTASARDTYERLTRESQSRRDLEQVMLELDQLARQVHGRIDTRIAKLEAIISHADRRIDELSRLLRAAAGRPTLDTIVGDESTAADPSPERGAPITPRLPSKSPDDHRALIYKLADAGLPSQLIAEKAERNIGEVELILALRRTRSRIERPAESASTSLPAWNIIAPG